MLSSTLSGCPQKHMEIKTLFLFFFFFPPLAHFIPQDGTTL